MLRISLCVPLKELMKNEISTKLQLPFLEGKSCLIFQLYARAAPKSCPGVELGVQRES